MEGGPTGKDERADEDEEEEERKRRTSVSPTVMDSFSSLLVAPVQE